MILFACGGFGAGCVPMVASYYLPESPSDTEIHAKHCWPNAFYSIRPAEGVTIRLQTAPSDRAAIEALYVTLAREDRFRLTDSVLTVTRPGMSSPILLNIDGFGRGPGRVSATSELQGPGQFMADVAISREKGRPEVMSVELPAFELNGNKISVPPVRYQLVKTLVVAAPECP